MEKPKTGYELFVELFNFSKKLKMEDYPNLEFEIYATKQMYEKFLKGENYFIQFSGEIFGVPEYVPIPIRGDSIRIDRDTFNRLNRIRKINIISNDEES